MLINEKQRLSYFVLGCGGKGGGWLMQVTILIKQLSNDLTDMIKVNTLRSPNVLNIIYSNLMILMGKPNLLVARAYFCYAASVYHTFRIIVT